MANEEQLKKLAQIFNTERIVSPEDIAGVLEAIVGILANNKKSIDALTEESRNTLSRTLQNIADEHNSIVSQVDKVTRETKSSVESEVKSQLEAVQKRVEDLIAECKDIMPEDGKDADQAQIVADVLSQIKLPEYKEVILDDGGEIVDKINSLNVAPENQIDWAHIKNAPENNGRVGGGLSRATADGLYQPLDTQLTSLSGLSYTGNALKVVRVNAGETAFELASAGSGSGDALVADPLSQFAATTSLQLKGVITDETGSGALVFGTSPTFSTSITGSYLTASEILITDGSKNIVSAAVATYPSLTELSYVKGVTSAIQTQLNAKGTFTLPALTAGSVLFSDGTTIAQDNANLFWDDTNNFFGVNNSVPQYPLHIATAGIATSLKPSAQAVIANETGSQFAIIMASATATTRGLMQGVRARGTLASPATVNSGDTLFSFLGSGYDGASVITGATIDFISDASVSTSNVPTKISFVTGTNVGNRVQRLGVSSGGQIAIGNFTPTALMHLAAGTATASTAPLKFTSGTLLTSPEAGAVEFLTDAFYGTITTGAARKTFAFLESPTFTGTVTLPTVTAGGVITLSENSSIALDPAGSADGKYSGTTVTGTGGATIAFGDLVTLDKDDSRWELVDISVAAAATGDARGIIGIAVTSSSDGGALTILLNGIIRADANFPTLTIGAAVYASTTGDIVVAQPTTTDHVIRVVGFALTADEIYFNPSNDYITHT